MFLSRIDYESGFAIVVDHESGLWLKWKIGRFEETSESGRFDFIADPFDKDETAIHNKQIEMLLWTKREYSIYL